jgi:predicted P-loop ATPase
MTTLEAARDWKKRGYFIVPIPSRKKGPTLKGWQNLRIQEDDLPRYFNGAHQNIGVLQGDTYGSTDVDLDCREALAAWPALAIETGLVFGRQSKPGSHWFYRSDPPLKAKKYIDPLDKATLIELRGLKSDGMIGLQTVVPPSIHECGEEVRFEPGRDGDPANVDAEVLVRAVAKTAAAAVLARHWPAAGQGRHDCELALAGVLARAGWEIDDARAFVLATYQAISDHDRGALGRVAKSVEDTYQKYAEGSAATGVPTLGELIDKKVVSAALRWLDISPGSRTTGNAQMSGHAAVVLNDRLASGVESMTAWPARLIRSDKGKQLPVVANALIALRYATEWQGVLQFDESSFNTVAKARPPWEETRALPFLWTDEDDVWTAAWLQHQGIMAGKETAAQAVQTVAREHPFHPIRDYLDSLKWDRVSRIDDWLTLYLGAEPSDYIRAVAAKFLIGAVARIYRPGCKNDQCLILEGPQGTLKSTALRVLTEPWFTDDMPELGTKDSSLQCRGPWLIELSELDSLTGVAVSRVKAFMSRSTDHFRPPYGRRPIDAPRECVFAATVNHGAYLKDETGARRFWPVVCGAITTAALKRDRDQLWAEARERFLAGKPWWLDSKQLVEAAANEQKDRYEGDPWDGLIAAWIKGRDSVSIEDILELCIGKKKDQWSQGDKTRIGRSLRAHGWERYRHRDKQEREYRFRKVHDVPR